MMEPDRRAVLFGAASLAGLSMAPVRALARTNVVDGRYAAIAGEPFPVPAVNLRRINPRFLRTAVAYNTDQPAGTIVIDPENHFLYLTAGAGQALRYGVGVGRQGFAWSGTAIIHDKREWPDWYPPKEMLARDPHLMGAMAKLQSGIGMHGGPRNPLGARAMYLFQDNKDTLFRIHGTVEPWSIGTSVSSGCIRMINQDVMDLFGRVPVGTTVVVEGDGQAPVEEVSRRERAPRERGLAPQESTPVYDADGNLLDGGLADPYRDPATYDPYRQLVPFEGDQ